MCRRGSRKACSLLLQRPEPGFKSMRSQPRWRSSEGPTYFMMSSRGEIGSVSGLWHAQSPVTRSHTTQLFAYNVDAPRIQNLGSFRILLPPPPRPRFNPNARIMQLLSERRGRLHKPNLSFGAGRGTRCPASTHPSLGGAGRPAGGPGGGSRHIAESSEHGSAVYRGHTGCCSIVRGENGGDGRSL